jgi:hypothetical protein
MVDIGQPHAREGAGMMKSCCAALVAVVALTIPSTAAADRTLDVDPHHLSFGKQPFNTFVTKTVTITNVSPQPLAVSIEAGFVPDDFSPGQPESTCPWFEPTTLAAGDSCTHVVGYYADPAPPFQGHRRIELDVVARDGFGQVVGTRKVIVTARGV